MSISSLSLESFNDRLAARTPTPAGGSAAAVVGSQAAALVSLVIRFTLGKPDFAGVAPELERSLAQSEALRRRLLALADEDAAAFEGVIAAYAMAKEPPEAKAARSAAIQTALKGATITPFTTAEQCLAVMQLIGPVVEVANPTVAGDGVTALLLVNGALGSSLANVRVNLQTIRDQAFVEEWAAKADKLTDAVSAAYVAAQLACEAAMGTSL
jgi:formiminotetrahydrofolate cyclodeaminase